MRFKLLPIFLSLLILTALPAVADESLQQTINFLLHRIETADATFIRNGEAHTPKEAVAHVRMKYEHFKAEIKTPEDFIRLAATKSLLSGQPYIVRTREGKETPLNAWLKNELKQHEKADAN